MLTRSSKPLWITVNILKTKVLKEYSQRNMFRRSHGLLSETKKLTFKSNINCKKGKRYHFFRCKLKYITLNIKGVNSRYICLWYHKSVSISILGTTFQSLPVIMSSFSFWGLKSTGKEFTVFK